VRIRLAVVAVVLAVLVSLLLNHQKVVSIEKERIAQQIELQNQVRGFLDSKKSPLAQETEFLLQQKHWKLLIAISAIESQYCKIQLGLNCWGITKYEGGYRTYSSIREGIADADALIERWQKKGRWLTVDDMNCHYVQPCNPNWVKVVNSILAKMDSYSK